MVVLHNKADNNQTQVRIFMGEHTKVVPHEQAGVIPYFIDRDILHTILITPKYFDDYWFFPKGNVEQGLTVCESAAKEAFEECGVEGIIETHPFAAYQYEKYGKEYEVKLYLLEVTHIYNNWPESGERKRRILTAENAVSVISENSLKQILANLKNYLLS